MSRKQLKEAAWAAESELSGGSADEEGPSSAIPQKKPLSKKNAKKLAKL